MPSLTTSTGSPEQVPNAQSWGCFLLVPGVSEQSPDPGGSTQRKAPLQLLSSATAGKTPWRYPVSHCVYLDLTDPSITVEQEVSDSYRQDQKTVQFS